MYVLHRPHLPKVGVEVFGPGIACAVAAILLLAIAAIDKLTGWELRLQFLYLIPVGLVAWSAGRRWGFVAAAAAVGLWLASFHNAHAYSSGFFLYADAAIALAVLSAFAALIDRLRRLEQMNRGREEETDHAEDDSDHA